MVSKTIVPSGTVGSNPTPSATRFERGDVGTPAGVHKVPGMLRRFACAALAGAVTFLAADVASAGTEAPSAADRAVAEAALFAPTDFPPGWTAQPSTDPPPSGIKSCQAIEAAVREHRELRAPSQEYERQPADRAQNSVYAFPTVKAAKRFLRTYARPGGQQCLRQTITQAVQDTQPDAQVELTTFDESAFDTGGIADDVLGVQFVITVPTASGPVATYLSAIAVRVGRFFDGFTFQHTSAPLPEGVGLVLASLGRLAAAIDAS
jgi:hypothetical protein